MAALLPGDPVPNWIAASDTNPRYSLQATGGRWVVLGVLGRAAAPEAAAALAVFAAGAPAVLDANHRAALLISADPEDRAAARIPQHLPQYRAIWDEAGAVTASLGGPGWLLLDPTQRLFARWELGETAAMLAMLARLPPPALHAGVVAPAPALIVPRIFEPELCRLLIARYREAGGQASGFMREVDGRTVGTHDPSFKVRRDHLIEDEGLRATLRGRLARRLAPEIQKAFQFQATRLERYLVACYRADEGGHFAAHRDNTTKGTAHRRFAVTINLNAEEFEGGDLVFPEFGRTAYRAPTGGAVVFSCSLLHQALPVTEGERFAFLPFLYDDAAAKIREANAQFIGASRG
ncbi:2OG-Fe(II) oxygenase family protein [Sediminicoccus rosea]|jgi:predicted 2-oxoglutarate/Fe(II)-dependent dioxygenase YbiX/peroxiredoxin|uniref:2OG-Fe(II) oxygenase n=1 Tax=Sediminicoccus rosea TaxID=1225128 RepID=A0ABZ0PKI4_9PROT|nr:2OG-Fe(II) oxygenase [Sediminicoccus rosea]WPB86184.1 2OG-Fe(II) oxygenase [Sediminicoccus rosea]